MSIQHHLAFTVFRASMIDPKKVAYLREQIAEVIEDDEGFISMTVWQRVDDSFLFASIRIYESLETTIKGIKALDGNPEMFEAKILDTDPPDMTIFCPIEDEIPSILERPVGSLMSMSIRVADLGRKDELVQDLSSTMQNLQSISGFAGHWIGENKDLEEEIATLAFWNSRSAFDASMPSYVPFKIRLYDRII